MVHRETAWGYHLLTEEMLFLCTMINNGQV